MKHILFVVILSVCSTYQRLMHNNTPKSLEFTYKSKSKQRVDPEERIFNGQLAIQGQFKYQVFLAIKYSEDREIKCGGSLISPQYVLTAAHCSWREKPIVMYFGLVTTGSRKEAVNTTAEEIYIHPGFNLITLANDIAVIKTHDAIELTDTVGVIALPTYSQAETTEFDDIKAIASGWGRTYDDEVGGHTQLMWTQVHVASQDWCQETLVRFNYSPERNICSDKSTNSTPCKGDSGGPVAIMEEGKSEPTLIGIVSWGIGKCFNPYPNVYVRVAAYLEFIDRVSDVIIYD